ncbi:LacI family DNA-binding transcriptional regulator [Streptomyces hygroscopicus subsp. hygroscopicus]|uniref:LacI family DNA-binding transcriptional regulator n=1 Tax=Streptomyces hygroscopicus TaxID=1912 RepID=UPI000767151E|nr:LacI family DNA-binding transcriptional regulator [Streptomyces hygroscopicus]MBW8087281.1 LacI family DNA-binding transcriptional regulator [Streptomyces hygroscopicus subsp. hygroscopicus]
MTRQDRKRPATLRTIAESAGVDVSTVSRVLNGSPAEVARAASRETADAIRDWAARLDYRPNPHAKSLRTARSNLIGVLVPRLSDLTLATIYEGIEDAAARHGLATFVMNSYDRPAEQRARVELALSRRVDGLILGDAHEDARLADEMAARKVPFVLVSRRAGGHPSATCDDYRGGGLVAEHFLRLGHSRVAVIAGEPFASTGLDRTAGFVDLYRKAGIEVPAVHSAFDTTGGHKAAEELLRRRPHPTAIFAVNDFAAIGALGAVRDAGLRPGEDVAVAGFNDTPLAAELPLPLTSVRSPMREMGTRALELLVSILGGQQPVSERLDPELIVRASTLPRG